MYFPQSTPRTLLGHTHLFRHNYEFRFTLTSLYSGGKREIMAVPGLEAEISLVKSLGEKLQINEQNDITKTKEMSQQIEELSKNAGRKYV